MRNSNQKARQTLPAATRLSKRRASRDLRKGGILYLALIVRSSLADKRGQRRKVRH